MEWTFDNAVARAGSEMSAIRTAAPSRAKRMVVSRPMPLGSVNFWKMEMNEFGKGDTNTGYVQKYGRRSHRACSPDRTLYFKSALQ